MKRLFRFRFTEPDRERYGDGTYELDCSPDGLSRVPIGVLEEFEDSTGMRVLGDWLDLLGSGQMKAIRAFMWLAVRVCDPDRPPVKFADFQPDVVTLVGTGEFRYIEDAEGNGKSPTRRAPKKTASRTRSASSSPAGRRRGSAS